MLKRAQDEYASMNSQDQRNVTDLLWSCHIKSLLDVKLTETRGFPRTQWLVIT
jgi:hypothetical protein